MSKDIKKLIDDCATAQRELRTAQENKAYTEQELVYKLIELQHAELLQINWPRVKRFYQDSKW